MRKDDLAIGKKYVLRPIDHKPDDRFTKVTYVGPVRSRSCRVRYEDGELRGLEEWVSTRLLVCPWDERKALLRDEERAVRLAVVDHEIWDSVTEEAISAVMTASGEYSGFVRRWDTDSGSADRYWKRAGLEKSPLDDHPANYQDRHGLWHLSFATALRASQGVRSGRTRHG